jgi:hypothetical protein
MNYIKTIISGLLISSCMSQTVYIHGRSDDDIGGKEHVFDVVPEQDLKKTIVSIYNKSLHTKIGDALPFEFKTCARKLINGNQVTLEECKEVLASYTELISTIINIHVRNVTSNNQITTIDLDASPSNEAILGILGKNASIVDSEGISQTLLNIESSLSDATCNAQLITNKTVGTTGFHITASGVYKLSENIIFTPTASAAALTITTSDVLLDLQCFSIKQKGTVAHVNAINIGSGSNTLENITVQGGLVSNISGTGIYVSNVSNFNLHHVTFTRCGLAGVDIEGTNNGVFIDGCNVSLSCTTGNNIGAITPTLACFQVNGVTNGKISNCDIYNNQIVFSANSVVTLFGLNMLNCNSLILENIVSSGNFNTAYVGFNITSCNNTIFNNCSSQKDSSGLSDLTAFALTSCNALSVFNSSVQGNIAGSQNAYGFRFNGSTGCLLKDCVILDNIDNFGSATGFRGIFLNGASFNTLENCSILRNQIAGLVSAINISSGSNNNLVSWCNGSFNTSTFEVSQGLLIDNVSNNNMIQDSDFSQNLGDVDGDSYGVNISVDSGNNLFTRVRAFNNGVTSANQLNGVPAGSQVALDTTIMNTTTNAGTFGNAAIVP